MDDERMTALELQMAKIEADKEDIRNKLNLIIAQLTQPRNQPPPHTSNSLPNYPTPPTDTPKRAEQLDRQILPSLTENVSKVWHS
jgi:hypothetical protein